MKVAYIKSLGGDLYLIAPLEAGHPDQGLPQPPGTPGHPLPEPPGDGKPPGNPSFPDNSLPGGPPPSVGPGLTLVLVRTPDGKWHYATVPASPPPSVMPDPPVAQPKA